jgi:TonB family protein
MWQRLGLRPGSSRDEIKRAYARKLKSCNPEDDPDGFKALRQAFELATRYADAVVYQPPEAPGSDEAEDGEDESGGEAGDGGPRHAPAARDMAEPADARPPADAAETAARAIDLEQRRETEALEAQLGRLNALLTGPDPQPEDVLREAFDKILASPALQQLATRDQVERWIAWRVASTVPRSDALVEPAILAFRWHDSSERHDRNPAVARVLARTEEWRFMNAAATPGDPLHLGWRALTGVSAPEWKLRLEGLSQARAAQVQSLLEIADHRLPGLATAFHPERVQWWQRYPEKPRITFDTLLLAPLVYYLATLVPTTVPIAVHRAVAAALAAAAPYLYFRLVKQRHHAWQTWQRPWPGPWVARGWMAAAALLLPAGMLLPASLAGSLALAGLTAAIVAWMVAAEPPQWDTNGLGERVRLLVGRLWWPCLFGWMTLLALRGHRADQFLIAVHGGAIIWWRGRDPMLAELERLVPRWRQAAAVALVAAAAGVTMLAAGRLGEGERLYPVATLVLFCGAVLALVWRAEGEANKFPLVLGWLLLATCYMAAFPEPAPDGPQSERAQPVATAQRLVITPNRGAWQRPQCPARPPSRPPGDAPIACSPQLWVFDEDETARALHAGAAGRIVSTLGLTISSSGAVTGCVPAGLQQASVLTAAACDALLTNALFLPGTDLAGLSVATTMVVEVDWLAGAPAAGSKAGSKAAPQPAPGAKPDAAPPPERVEAAIAPPPPAECPAEPDPPTGPLPLRPCGSMGEWTNAGDYPAEARRRGETGTSRVLVAVTEEGRPSRCTVDQASGSKALDQATCDLMMKRGRFLPPRDEAGKALPTELRFTMKWVLED